MQFQPACTFFLEDIYAPRDFSQRDFDVERIHSYLSRFLPAATIRLLTDTVELNHLTNQLDHELMKALFEKLGVTDAITPDLYAQGYRTCDNYAERLQQIELTIAILREVGAGARHPLVGTAIRIGSGPAKKAGAPWLIFLIGYLPFFLVSFWAFDLESVSRKIKAVGAILGFDAACLVLFAGVLKWI